MWTFLFYKSRKFIKKASNVQHNQIDKQVIVLLKLTYLAADFKNNQLVDHLSKMKQQLVAIFLAKLHTL